MKHERTLIDHDQMLIIVCEGDNGHYIAEMEIGGRLTATGALHLIDSHDSVVRVGVVGKTFTNASDLSERLAREWLAVNDWADDATYGSDAPAWIVDAIGEGELDDLIAERAREVSAHLSMRRDDASLELAGRV